MKDTFKHKGLRNKLASEVKSKGILDLRVLNAIESIPRHLFMDSSFIDHAYQDKAFPIGAGQTISQPYTVAFQSELLNVKKGDKILEIGTGSGYQTAVLDRKSYCLFYRKTKGIIQKNKFIFTKNWLPSKKINFW